jgi:hypothetical protein
MRHVESVKRRIYVSIARRDNERACTRQGEETAPSLYCLLRALRAMNVNRESMREPLRALQLV